MYRLNRAWHLQDLNTNDISQTTDQVSIDVGTDKKQATKEFNKLVKLLEVYRKNACTIWLDKGENTSIILVKHIY